MAFRLECAKWFYRVLSKFKYDKGKNTGASFSRFYRRFAAQAISSGSDGQGSCPSLPFRAEEGQIVLRRLRYLRLIQGSICKVGQALGGCTFCRMKVLNLLDSEKNAAY